MFGERVLIYSQVTWFPRSERSYILARSVYFLNPLQQVAETSQLLQHVDPDLR